MREVSEYLREKGIICKSLKEVDLKTRKKLSLFIGVGMDNRYIAVVRIGTKSRFLTKNAKELLEMLTPFIPQEIKAKNRFILISAPICSKATAFLESQGWKIF